MWIEATIAGAMTGVRALGIWFLNDRGERISAVLMVSCAAFMLFAVWFGLLVPAWTIPIVAHETQPQQAWVLLALFLGIGLMRSLDRAIKHLHPAQSMPSMKPNAHTLHLLVAALAIHNVPEGFAVGAAHGLGTLSHGLQAYETSAQGAGFTTAMFIGLQNIPEGLMVAWAIWGLGYGRAIAAGIAFATGMVEPIGALLGFWVSSVWQYGGPFAMGLAAGAMVYVVVHELLPEGWKLWASATHARTPSGRMRSLKS